MPPKALRRHRGGLLHRSRTVMYGSNAKPTPWGIGRVHASAEEGMQAGLVEVCWLRELPLASAAGKPLATHEIMLHLE